MAYGSDSTYTTSNVKSVVNAWAQAKFTDELKTVDGYSARLLKYEEFPNLGYENKFSCTGGCYYSGSLANVPSWVYNNNYWYWTMSPNNDSSFDVWNVGSGGNLYNSDVRDNYGAVRPVINVYKSKISS